MENNIQHLRNLYQQFRKASYANDVKPITGEKLKQAKNMILAEKNRINESGQSATFNELMFYEQKFNDVGKLMKLSSKNSYSKNKYLDEMKKLLIEQKYIHNGSQKLRESSKNPQQNVAISEFFKIKKSKLYSEVGFKSIFDNAPVTNKQFKKKQIDLIVDQVVEKQQIEQQPGISREAYERLKEENQHLMKKLKQKQVEILQMKPKEDQKMLEQREKMLLEERIEEKRKIQRRLREVEEENLELIRQNAKLRSEKTITYHTVQIGKEYDEPYNFQPLPNDLYRINIRNQNDSSSQGYYFQDRVLPQNQEVVLDTLSEGINSKKYGSFDMEQSVYSERDIDYFSSQAGIKDSKTVAKNKLAFFKRKLIISKDSDYEIAMKKSQLEGNYEKLRFIFYVHNKTSESKSVNLSYKYDKNYYEIDVKEKMTNVLPHKEARQVIEIRFNGILDLNSIIDARLIIGGKQYKLWVPAIFVQFSAPQKLNQFPKNVLQKVIYPHKQFSSMEKFEDIFPFVKIKENEGEIWGKSKLYSGPIYLKWKENKLKVKTSEKWLHLLTFLLFDYQD